MNERPPELRTDLRRPLGVGGILLLVLVVGIFSSMAVLSVSGAVVAAGKVVVRGKPNVVQHLDGGIVKEFRVRTGDLIRAGDVLVRLDDTLLKANLQIYRNRLREALASKARLEAERDDAAGITFDDESGTLFGLGDNAAAREGETKLFEARRATRLGEIEQQRETIRRYANQIAGVEGLIEAKRRQLDLVEDELDGLGELLAQGHASKVRVIAKEREQADLNGQLAEHRAEIARVDNSIIETEIAIKQIEREFREAVLSEMREVTRQTDDLIQQIVATTKQLERVEIRAPVNGLVHEMAVNTIGEVVPPGGKLMELVPTDEAVEFEANVEPQHIDQVRLGQQAVVRFTAFNQRTTPELFGAVAMVPPSSIVEEQSGLSFYRVAVAIAPEEMSRLGTLHLISGMPVEIHLQTGERTILSYLLKPLTDHLHRALRE